MVVILKKIGIVIFFLLILTAVVMGILFKSVPSVSQNVTIDQSSVIVIDAGHGGADGGALSLAGICEKEYNLSIAKKLEALFADAGIKTVMTRTGDDIDLEYPEEQTPLERKRNDLKFRKEMAKEKNADLLISIHMNKFTSASVKGAQTFYDKTFPVSEEIAALIQSEFVRVLDPENRRKEKQADSSIYLMKNPHVPSVLVECGFLSNPEEEANLRDEAYQEKVAMCIYSGVMKYLNGEKKEKVPVETQNPQPSQKPDAIISDLIKEYYG